MNDLNDKIIIIAKYYIDNKSTFRKTGKRFNISKSTVHAYLTYKLPLINKNLYYECREICEHNIKVRHLLGGEGTRKMYEIKRLSKEGK